MTGGAASSSFVAGNVHLEQGATMSVGIHSDAVEQLMKRTTRRIQEWTRGMVETAALTKIIDKLNSGTSWLTITGQPGEGKTTAAYMTLEKLQQSGRQVFQVTTPEEFSKVTMVFPPPVILLDDILGTFEFDETEWSRWRRVIYDILDERQHTLYEKTLNEEEVTIMFVSRNYIINGFSHDTGKISRYFSDKRHVVVMSNSEERALLEKVAILKAISGSKSYPLDKSTIDKICSASGPHGFPNTCRLYVTLKLDGVEIDTVRFMESPLEFLNETFEKFFKNEKKKQLFMKMLKADGKISVSELLKLDLKNLADSLVDSYLRKEDDCYTFHHLSIYDSASYNLAKSEPLFVIESCSLFFLHERLRLDTQHATHSSMSGCVVNIPRYFIKDLAKRFAAEIKNRNLMLVLSQNALTDYSFIEVLMPQIGLKEAELLALTDRKTKNSFLSLIASNKSPHLLRYIDKEIKSVIQMAESDINTVLYGICKYAASDVLTYLEDKHGRFDINVTYEYDKTPLMIASETKDSKFVKQIIALEPNLNTRDSLGQTVLHYLIQNSLETAVEQVINRVPDIDVKDRCGRSPLWWACRLDQGKVVKLLLEKKAMLDAETVVLACRSCSFPVVKLLFERGARLDMTAYSTPLTAAIQSGRLTIVRFLIDEGASVNISDWSGQSLLHGACNGNEPQAIQLLLILGAAIDSTDKWGNTPLHIAAGRGHNKCVDVLLKAGADETVNNNNGNTPLHTAAGRGYKECVDMLMEAQVDRKIKNKKGADKH